MKNSGDASHVDVEHEILPSAWRYRIVGLHLELAPVDGDEPFLDLMLELDGTRRRLRFLSPQDIEIERGGPVSGGLQIFDVSARGLDRLSVRVTDGEASPGSLRFWARRVDEVTST